MKYHDGFCQGQPCAKEHHYLCVICDTRFITSATTHFTPEGRYTVPTINWPTCSPFCLAEHLAQSAQNDQPFQDNPFELPGLHEGDTHLD